MNQFLVKDFYKFNNYKIVNNENLDDLLSKSNKVISTYSSVTLESALRSITIGLVYNKEKLLLNPFDYTNLNNYKLISNYLEMDKFLNIENEVKEVNQVFNINKEYYKVFLGVT